MQNTETGRCWFPRRYIDYLLEDAKGLAVSCPSEYKSRHKVLHPDIVDMRDYGDTRYMEMPGYLNCNILPCYEIEVEVDVNYFDIHGNMIKEISEDDLKVCSRDGDALEMCREVVTELGFVAPKEYAIPYLMKHTNHSEVDLKAMDLYELSVVVMHEFARQYKEFDIKPGLI